MSDDDSDENPSFMKHTLQVPCYRSSLMFGITSGIVSGLGFFLFTSQVKRATHVGLGAYVSTTLASWVYCRYKLTEQMIKERQFRQAIQERLLQEGVTPAREEPVVKLDDV